MALVSGDPASLVEVGPWPRKARGLQAVRRYARRCASVAAALALVVLSFPLWVIIAIGVSLESPGFPIFVQDRVGFEGRIFRMYKFRTMKRGSETRAKKNRRDDRVTRAGVLLRRTSLDELPQLLNVVRGNMGFVGPRPELPHLLAGYAPEHYLRFRVVPGMTGLWQVNGRSDLSLAEKLELDLEYVGRRSLALDATILARTPWTVLSGRGAY